MCECNKPVTVKIKRLNKNIPIPEQADKGSVGFDLRISFKDLESYKLIEIDGDGDRVVSIAPNEKIMFSTECKVEIPEGYFMYLHPRSSMGIKKNLILSNLTAVIDSSYRGEIFISVRNIGERIIKVKEFERIVQGIILPYPKIQFEDVEELSDTERGENGIGSSGEK